MESKNKLLWFATVFIVIGVLLTNCTSQPPSQTLASSGGITLDQAIAEAAMIIDERLGLGSRIAMLNFNSPSDRFSLYVLDELTANLIDSGKLTIVDRNEVDLIRNEFEFQLSGEVGDDSIQELGRMLGAQSIVSGSLTEIGGDYRIVIRVLNVQNATVTVQYRSDINNDRRVQALLEGGRTSGSTTASGTRTAGGVQTVQPPPQAAVPANGTYTFIPRLRAYMGASAVDAYISHIIVRGDFMAVYITSTMNGPWRPAGRNVFRDRGSVQNVRLRDLDNPSQIFLPEAGRQSTHSWDDNGEWFTFRGVRGRRFSLTITHEAQPLAWDEITLGEPDRN